MDKKSSPLLIFIIKFVIFATAASAFGAYPADPSSNWDWKDDTGCGYSGVSDIACAFNAARTHENTELGTSLTSIDMPDQSTWNAMSNGEKALWLINEERVDRGVHPLEDIETNVENVAQTYADYLLANDAWGHYEDGNDPWERLRNNSTIGACYDYLSVAENLAVFVSDWSISLPIERSVYNWMYADAGLPDWGHRHAILWYSYNDNGGDAGEEGFLGIGLASGGPYKGPFPKTYANAEIIVMNVFDPCSTWDYEEPPEGPIVYVSEDGNCGGLPDCHDTIQSAVESVAGALDVTIKVEQGDYLENYDPPSLKNIIVDEEVSLIIGYDVNDPAYTNYSTLPTLITAGSRDAPTMTIQKGLVTFWNVVLQ